MKQTRSRQGRGKAIGIITSTPAGSLGDQAMIDSSACFLAREYGRPVWIAPNGTRTRIAARMPGDSKLSKIGLAAGMVARCRSLGFVGADVLDGVYGASAVLARLRLMRLAERLGCRIRVFGASWSHSPDPAVIAALRRMKGLEICARDVFSKARIEKALEREVMLVADTAFLLRPGIDSAAAREAQDWLRTQRGAGKLVLGLNVSGHSLKSRPDDGLRAYHAMIRDWLQADPDRAVLLMPHDYRSGLVGDVEMLTRLRDLLRPDFAERLHLPAKSLMAWELKALAGEVDLVMTGRMHLAIAALGMATPALCTVYQDKFEGLMEHFGLDGLTMTLDEVLTGQGRDRLAQALERRAELASRISARLPDIERLSRRNFSGM